MSAPEQALVLVTFTDDSVALMNFVTEEHRTARVNGWRRELTTANIEVEVRRFMKSHPRQKVKGWRVVTRKELPPELQLEPPTRLFRAALTDAGDEVRIDMEAAREIARRSLRITRSKQGRAWVSDPALKDIDKAKTPGDLRTVLKQLQPET